jgi:integrase
MSRNPYFPISRILDLQHPMQAIFLLLKRLDKAASTVYEWRFANAVMRREIALIALIGSNPLRARHFSEMRYRPGDDTSNLYRRDKKWYLRFPREAFKNFRGTASKERYDYPVADFAAKYLDEYINVYRDRLGWGDEMDLVFPNARYGTENPVRFTGELSEKVRVLTAHFLPEFAPYGFGGHAFRHIVATEFIRNHLAGIEIAARILHDKEETVRKAYSWVKGVDHAKVWTAYVDGLNDRYQSGNNAA